MKQLTYFLCLLIPFLTLAQVGIGTTNPTKDLDVNGELRVRVVNEQLTDSIVTVDGNGNIGYRDINTILSGGNYQRVKTYSNAPYDVIVTGVYADDNISLDMFASVIIPADFNGMLDIRASVPMGLASSPDVIESYIGLSLWRLGVQLPNESRKFSLDKDHTGNDIVYRMGYVEIEYWEAINNVGSPAYTLTFQTRGIIEHAYSSDVVTTYRFRMWDAIPSQNYNWGRAYIEYELKSF